MRLQCQTIEITYDVVYIIFNLLVRTGMNPLLLRGVGRIWGVGD
jgi:hypothetical protein